MNTSQNDPAAPQIAVWYFVAATFIFAAPALFFPDAEVWLRVVLILAGFVVVVLGGIQLGREISHRRGRRDPSGGASGPTEG